MQPITTPPITREIIDRRQPAIRWSAVLAGTAVAVGLWGVFQLLGLGAGLFALDPDDARSLRHAAIGAGAFSALAPLIACFGGGWLAARLCTHSDRKVAAGHGIVVWGLTTVAGLVATLGLAKAAAIGHAHDHDMAYDDAYTAPAPATYDTHRGGVDEIQKETPATSVGPGKIAPPMSTVHATDTGRLDDRNLMLNPDERLAIVRAKQTGKGLLTLAIAMLLSLGTAILGAILGVRAFDDRRNHTAPYPVTDATLP